MHHLERKHLASIVAIAEKGSLARAAEQLCLSQSALSHQIKKLEYNLNCRLLMRLPQGIQLTEQGKTLANAASAMLKQFDQLEQQLAPSPQQPLSLAMPCYYCFQWLLPSLQHVQPALSFDLVDDLLEQQFGSDLILTDEIITDVNYQQFSIGCFELVLICGRQHVIAKQAPLEPKHLTRQKWLTYAMPLEQLDLYQLLIKPAQLEVVHRKAVNNSLQLLQQVATSDYLALVPDWLTQNFGMQCYINQLKLKHINSQKQLWFYVKKSVVNQQGIDELVSKIRDKFTLMQQNNKKF